jgi:DNA-nicking Smr family endonuclease
MNKYERVPDYVLDLHGYTTREAGEVLDDIIEGGEYRHIRIITGKGTFRETGPVLRTFVENYLKNREIKFQTSKLHNGGDGALEAYLT